MSKFKLEDGIPVARRDRASKDSCFSKPRLVAGKSQSVAPILVVVSGLTLTTAGIAGSFWSGIGATSSVLTETITVVEPQADPVELEVQDSNSRESIFGHFEYDEAAANDLRPVGQFNGRLERLHVTAATRFQEMQANARQSGIHLLVISGFRSVEVQEFLFFQVGQSQSLTPQERALVSAPPGYSEHHTGYAVDIGDVNYPQSHLEVSFERTPAFRWLEANAARYGFELSFPQDNPYGVNYEPWHWRFVGDRDSLSTFHLGNHRSTGTQADAAAAN
ncbi:MAG: M15 family metallopeptidase [Cyanobacteria bacterium P01_F01_bin.86]